ncbi:hypothetical protein [Blastococcus sp. TF02A-35]|uniref:hypothetical protein n=1 Tax=Blastococcus sp. TF02A-35 TaxID=2559612 RepID=UPI0010739451|nr:hypothetical protein [Blastococcus sp. TF02A_35]TFV47841.1 hypothetical protein E4P43_14525 [Blastococcus sp. TF02A_35]
MAALVMALLVEAAPVVGGDLVAQEWWASWASSSRAPVDLGWYGGVTVASYSLLSPWAGALLGLPVVGVLGTVLGTAATTALLGRLDPTRVRWTVAGVCGAAMWAANEWSGRTTFGLGAALGCLALVVVSGRPRPSARVAGAVLAALAGATSPVAAAFLVLAAAAWWCGRQPSVRVSSWRPGPVEPWLVAGGALLSVVVAKLLGAVSGPQPTSAHQMLAAVGAAVLTASLLPAGHRVLRLGAVLTALLLLATWLVSSPVGSTSTRLVLLFAVPVLVASPRARPAVAFLAAAGVVWLLPPLVVKDLMPRDAVPPAPQAETLLAELRDRGPVGRIEVVPLNSHEESMSVAQGVPLARGWLRQLDTVHAGLFYDGSLDAGTYLAWLRDAGVSHVVLPRAPLDWPSGGEARLLRQGVPGLTEVWSDRSWRLFEVAGGGMLRGEATLVSSDRSRVVVDVPAAGEVEVALRWSQWSSVEGPQGCVGPGGRDGWTTLRADRPGRFVLSSSWQPAGRCD